MKRIFLKYAVVAMFFAAGFAFLVTTVAEGEGVSREEYNAWVSESYDFRFGKDKPFAPGNANTFNGEFIPGTDFVSANRCGKCHTDAHPQWAQSAHAKAFVEPFYQKNVNDLVSQKNIAFTRHCESCHNPAALFSGALTDKPRFKERPFDEEGVSCIVCHSIEKVTGRGIGGYVMGQPALIQEPDGTKVFDVTDEDIQNDIDGHKRAMMRPLLKEPKFCAACHKSQVPKELNDYKFIRAFMVGDEYQQSSFSKEVPHPFYTRDRETCNSCHMKKVPTRYYDVSVKDEMIKSHRFAAANTAIPYVYGYKDQFEEVTRFLQDDKVGIDIFGIHRSAKGSTKEKLIAPVNREDFRIKGGDSLTVDVIVTNKNIGHSFPPELRDFYEAYVEFTVTDPSGNTLYKSGFIDSNGDLDPKAHNYKTFLVKPDGSLNDIHHIWQTRVVAYNNAIPSGKSDLARYKFEVPENLEGELKLTASVQYRRFTRVYSDYVMGRETDFPIVTMATAQESFLVGDKTKAPPRRTVDTSGDWKRWNHYGIALLDQKQFPQAADAFDEVIDFKNDYRAYAYTNKALAFMQMGGWQDADKLIDKALELDSENYRAIFQQARIRRVLSDLEGAEADFLKVLEKYPNDRMTLQQMGELAKIKSDALQGDQRTEQLKVAKGYYDRVMEIDPEDLSAIYNLMLINQKLGDKKAAAELAAIFRDLKDDPQVSSLASNFLQANSDVGNESLPFHAHELAPFDPASEVKNYLSLLNIDWDKKFDFSTLPVDARIVKRQ
jgi:tetratricopeptide (TPR) repeat protein